MYQGKKATRTGLLAVLVALVPLGLVGCSGGDKGTAPTPTGENVPTSKAARAAVSLPEEVVAERAKLSPEDRALVDTQQWCVVSADEFLGSMGAPIKLDIKGQPVFVCCKGCKRKAESDPEKTLAKVAELKAKAQKAAQ